jgi:hypothetical protein
MPKKPKKKTKKEKKETTGYYWDGIKSYVLKKTRNVLGI